MTQEEFEPLITVFEWSETVCGLERLTTGTGVILVSCSELLARNSDSSAAVNFVFHKTQNLQEG